MDLEWVMSDYQEKNYVFVSANQFQRRNTNYRINMYVYMHVCMHACMHVLCMYVCMYVCMVTFLKNRNQDFHIKKS